MCRPHVHARSVINYTYHTPNGPNLPFDSLSVMPAIVVERELPQSGAEQNSRVQYVADRYVWYCVCSGPSGTNRTIHEAR